MICDRKSSYDLISNKSQMFLSWVNTSYVVYKSPEFTSRIAQTLSQIKLFYKQLRVGGD